MHWDDYASVVGDTRIAQVRAHMSPQPSKAFGGVGVGITAAGSAGRFRPHLPPWPGRRTIARARHAQSAQVPGMIRAYLQLLERSNPDVCRRAGASGFFFRDGGDAVHSAIERMLAPWSRISTISSTVWKVMSSTFSAFRRSAFRRS